MDNNEVVRNKMMYHIVDGKFRGWIYKEGDYGVELNKLNGYFEIEDDQYNKLEQERIEKGGAIVGYNGGLKVVVYPKEFINPIYDNLTDRVIDNTPLDEQIEHYKSLIIQKTRELGIENLAGFGNPNLELELNKLKKIHLEKSHELAISMDQNI